MNGRSALLLLVGACAVRSDRPAPSSGQEMSPPGTMNVQCDSTKGPFTIEMHPEWAPLGAKRFLDLVGEGVYDGTVMYRVIKHSGNCKALHPHAPVTDRGCSEAVQYGLPKDRKLRDRWNHAPNLKDDPQIFRNPNFHRGMISFAGAGANTRSVDVFVTFMTSNANGNPQTPWETPFGIIDEAGLVALTNFTWEYGVHSIHQEATKDGGYELLKKSHPNVDYLGKCSLVPAHTDAPNMPTAAPTLQPTAPATISRHGVLMLNGALISVALLAVCRPLMRKLCSAPRSKHGGG